MTRAKASSAWGPFLPSTFSASTMPAALTTPRSVPELRRHFQPAANAGFVGHVDARESHAAAKLRHEPRASRLVDVGDDTARARFDEHARRRFAQSRGAAGDEEDVALKLQGLERHYRLTVCAFSAVSMARRTAS